jgi:2-aminoethylphosphonate-pyruvate transaminase
MLKDWCTWDAEYNEIVQDVRKRLIKLATAGSGYTSVLMQGSGTFAVESALGTIVPKDGKLLVMTNGAYGDRIVRISRIIGIETVVQDSGEVEPPDIKRLGKTLAEDGSISHVAVVHCETTTGILNPIEEIGRVVKQTGRAFLVDAMSSFGGIPMDCEELGIDVLVSSANKCIQGVPGFGFIIARSDVLTGCEGHARSLSLDAYDQWRTMEEQNGKWRFTSPTHVVRAFLQALIELEEEGLEKRHARYSLNQKLLVDGMENLGFRLLIDRRVHSPIITSFLYPDHPDFSFDSFYSKLKTKGFVIYPGKVSVAESFRIGTIGNVHPKDILRLLKAVEESRYW